MLFISIMCLSNLLWGLQLLGPEGLPLSVRLSSLLDIPFENHHTSTSNKFSACEKGLQTPAESEHLRPMDVSKIQYKRVLEAEHVVAYIVREMDKMGAPVSIMFGSVLHEYRNSTGNCVEYNMRDKDFDMVRVVLPEDFPKLFGLIDNIKAQFGWEVMARIDERLILVLGPRGVKRPGKGFQIDIYRFHRDQPEKGLLYFPLDRVSFEMDLFFPLVKYKSIASMIGVNEIENDSSNSTRISDSMESPVPVHYHMPANVSCLLAKMYGDDFMTPKLGPGNKGHGTRENVFRKSNWCRGEIDTEKEPSSQSVYM